MGMTGSHPMSTRRKHNRRPRLIDYTNAQHLLSSFSKLQLNLSTSTMPTVGEKQCEVVLVGCGAPGRGMGWYHAEQMLKGKCPSAKLLYIVEPWFLGAGTYSTASGRR